MLRRHYFARYITLQSEVIFKSFYFAADTCRLLRYYFDAIIALHSCC